MYTRAPTMSQTVLHFAPPPSHPWIMMDIWELSLDTHELLLDIHRLSLDIWELSWDYTRLSMDESKNIHGLFIDIQRSSVGIHGLPMGILGLCMDIHGCSRLFEGGLGLVRFPEAPPQHDTCHVYELKSLSSRSRPEDYGSLFSSGKLRPGRRPE